MELPCYSHLIVKKYKLVTTTQQINSMDSVGQFGIFNSKLWHSKSLGLNHYDLLSGDLKLMQLSSYSVDRPILFSIISSLFFSSFSGQYLWIGDSLHLDTSSFSVDLVTFILPGKLTTVRFFH